MSAIEVIPSTLRSLAGLTNLRQLDICMGEEAHVDAHHLSRLVHLQSCTLLNIDDNSQIAPLKLMDASALFSLTQLTKLSLFPHYMA